MRRVSIANRHSGLRCDRREVARLIAELDRAQTAITRLSTPMPAGELSIVFLTDAELAQLHAEFLDDPSTTDVITFAGDPAAGTAGEICVSVDTAAAYAKKHRREFSAELALYLVHGWLHLAGLDDLVPEKKRAMRRAEGRALQVLRGAKALPRFALAQSVALRRARR